jgi:hypothetical protein
MVALVMFATVAALPNAMSWIPLPFDVIVLVELVMVLLDIFALDIVPEKIKNADPVPIAVG